MKNSKTTKRALFSSVMSLLLCVSMLIGTTFAWFTDTASTGVNKIVAGNLDVELEMWDGSKYINISQAKAPIFGAEDSTIAQNNNLNTLWEPGKTQVAYLAIKNEGNLALKYKVNLNTVNPADGNNLYKVMQYQIVPDAKDGAGATWTAGTGKSVALESTEVSEEVTLNKDETHYFALLIHMDENADSTYANGKVEFDITVNATQDNVEHDSFGNNYDVTAGLEEVISDGIALDKQGNYAIYNAAGMIEYREMMDNKGDFKNKTVYLLDDIDMTGYKWDTISWAHYEDGYKLGGMVFDGKGHKVSNLFINGAGLFDGLIANDTVTFKNVTFDKVKSPATSDQDQFKGVFVGDLYNDVIFEKVTVSNTNIGGYWGIGAFVGRAGSESSVDIKIRDSHVTNFEITAPWNYYTSSFVGLVNNYDNGNDTITFNGANTITNFTVKVNDLVNNNTGGSIHTDVSKHPNVTVTNVTVNGYTVK